MPDYKIGTREEWQAARDELAKLEAEHAKLGDKVTEQRRQLPWVPVEREYQFDTEGGKKTLAELFDGRSQLLAYNIMFGPDYELGACPGCSNLGDELEATRVHLNHRDVTLICFSRAPIDRLIASKQRMGWQFPYVSTYETEFPFDFGIALTPEQAQEIPEVKEMIDKPHSGQVNPLTTLPVNDWPSTVVISTPAPAAPGARISIPSRATNTHTRALRWNISATREPGELGAGARVHRGEPPTLLLSRSHPATAGSVSGSRSP
jgi:predicted dithiol-disulfide oxidoreductase (DUF899 family)